MIFAINLIIHSITIKFKSLNLIKIITTYSLIQYNPYHNSRMIFFINNKIIRHNKNYFINSSTVIKYIKYLINIIFWIRICKRIRVIRYNKTNINIRWKNKINNVVNVKLKIKMIWKMWIFKEIYFNLKNVTQIVKLTIFLKMIINIIHELLCS
jgi:hypothetical protein